MFIFVTLVTHVKSRPLLWHMGGEYRPATCPNYPLVGSKELRLLTTAQDVIHQLVPPHDHVIMCLKTLKTVWLSSTDTHTHTHT